VYVTLPAFLFAGNDGAILDARGSTADNVPVDGAGNDVLRGGRGHDLLIGGLGADTHYGNAGDDLHPAQWQWLQDGPVAMDRLILPEVKDVAGD
jgi:hypothetical protein